MLADKIKVIAFDADDTLWVNEPFFREAEAHFCKMLSAYANAETLNKVIYEVTMRNLNLYGYGVKAFILSLIEAANEITENNLDSDIITALLGMGKQMLQEPLELLLGIEQTLQYLVAKYTLIVITKGDLLDQQTKVSRSGLSDYFSHISVVSHKNSKDYETVFKELKIKPSEVLMVGNSMKSDVLPILALGGYACHIPFHTTWEHERAEIPVSEKLFRLKKSTDLIAIL